MTAPNGVFVQSFNTSTYSAAPFSLPFAGTYTLTVYSYGTTGNYHFTLDNLSAAPTINLSPDAGTAESNQTLATGLATNFYQIDGMAGQRLYFQALADSAGASDLNWTLYGPSGTVVASSRFSSPSTWYDLTLTLPSDGTYLLAVTGTNPGNTSVTYNFEVYDTANPTAALTFDQVVSGQIGDPFDEATYTFTGSVGQKILIQNMGSSSRCMPSSTTLRAIRVPPIAIISTASTP